MRLPIWRVSWLTGALGLCAALLAGLAALAYAWIMRPAPDETPAREANVAVVDHISDNLVSRFDTPVASLQRLAERFAENDLAVDDTFAIIEALNATLAATQGLQSLAFIDQRLGVVEAQREAGSIAFSLRDLGDSPDARQRLAEVQAGGPGSSQWSPLVYSDGEDSLTSTLAVPAFRDGQPLGMLRARVRLPENVAGAVAAGKSTPFILVGSEYVQFHPYLAPPESGRARTATPVNKLGDPAVTAGAASIENGGEVPERIETSGGTVLVDLRELPGPGGEPWFVGAYRALPQSSGILALAPLAIVLGAIALVMLAIGLQFGGRIDRSLSRQAGAIGSAAAFKLGPRPRLPRSSLHGIEAINHAIVRLGRKMENIPGVDTDVAAPSGVLPGKALRPRGGEALVVWIEASLPEEGAGTLTPGAMATAINAELGLMTDRLELEGAIALPYASALAGVWFTAADEGATASDDTMAEPPADIRKLARDLVTIASGAAGEASAPRPVFSAGVARGEAVLAEFGPPRRKRFGIAGPAAEQARRDALAAAGRPQGHRVEIGEGVERTESADDEARRPAGSSGASGSVRLSPVANPTNR